MKRATGLRALLRSVALCTLSIIAIATLLGATVVVSQRAIRDGLAQRLLKVTTKFSNVLSQGQRPPNARSGTIGTRQVTTTVISKFLPYVREDLEHGETGRAALELSSLEAMVDRLSHKGGADSRATITYQNNLSATRQGRRLRVEAGAIIELPAQGSAHAGTRPVFLAGYDGFQQVRDDVQLMPLLGANLIQIEIGPSHIYPQAGVTDRTQLDALVRLLDRAAEAGVAVDVLLSPHYFPSWMFESVPALRRLREGFVQFCVHHPAGREFLRQYIRTVVHAIKDHPALLSVCLANEPANTEEPCPYATQNWKSWLKIRHGGMEGYNRDHHAALRDLEGVPLPNPFKPPSDRAIWMDYIRFNQEQHAEWLESLASAVHEEAPDLPVHVKTLTPELLGRRADPSSGLDPTLLARIGRLNGNDAYNLYQYERTDFAESWQENAMGHDLQKSLNPAPIFNSENHIIFDRDSRAVPPAHVRAALWQAAVHGQAATTIWVWERTFDHKSDFWASILERPDAVEAVGLTNIDLNRAALELRALQNASSNVTILSSVSALVWDRHVPAITEALYTALSFTGLKIGFITERQLESGISPPTSTLFIPGNIHMSHQALRALSEYRGRIVFVGKAPLLSRDDHDQPATLTLPGELLGLDAGTDTWRLLWAQLPPALVRWNVMSEVQVTDAHGNPVWGIEWQSTRDSAGAQIVNLCNFRYDSIAIQLQLGQRIASGRDVLTGIPLPKVILLGSLETKLVRLD